MDFYYNSNIIAGEACLVDKRKPRLLDKSFVIFLLIGGLNTLLNWIIMLVLYTNLGMDEWTASAIGYTLTSALSFFLNRKFSFRSKGAFWGDLIRFALVIGACYLIANLIAFPFIKWLLDLPAFVSIQRWSGQIALIFGNVLFTILNYFGQRFFAFNREEQ